MATKTETVEPVIASNVGTSIPLSGQPDHAANPDTINPGLPSDKYQEETIKHINEIMVQLDAIYDGISPMPNISLSMLRSHIAFLKSQTSNLLNEITVRSSRK